MTGTCDVKIVEKNIFKITSEYITDKGVTCRQSGGIIKEINVVDTI